MGGWLDRPGYFKGVKSEAIYQTFTYIGSLAWNYISSKIPTDVSYICFKNYAKLHIQANSLPQIRLNV